MACDAAIRHARANLSHDDPRTAANVFERIRWWTPDTIQEALDARVAAGSARRCAGLPVAAYVLIGALR